MAGFWIVVGVLVACCGFGLWRRLTDGRLRDASPRPVRDDAPPAHVDTPDAAHHGGEIMTEAQLGQPLGDQATFVQFSSAFCQPCRATRLLLDDVTRDLPGVSHVELDAESHLDLVRHLQVRRTPTVLLLDANGAIRKRATGLPRRTEVVAALGQVVPT
ncbi:MAG: thioredoxin family protein [Candidatus Nanopelagicales bacterium]